VGRLLFAFSAAQIEKLTEAHLHMRALAVDRQNRLAFYFRVHQSLAKGIESDPSGRTAALTGNVQITGRLKMGNSQSTQGVMSGQRYIYDASGS